jgi:hypothetical protein
MFIRKKIGLILYRDVGGVFNACIGLKSTNKKKAMYVLSNRYTILLYNRVYSRINAQFFLQHRSCQKQLTVRESPLTKPAHAAWTLLRMDPWGPKRCRAHWFVNKLGYIRTLCICWSTYTLQDDTRSIQHQVKFYSVLNVDCIILNWFNFKYL